MYEWKDLIQQVEQTVGCIGNPNELQTKRVINFELPHLQQKKNNFMKMKSKKQTNKKTAQSEELHVKQRKQTKLKLIILIQPAGKICGP